MYSMGNIVIIIYHHYADTLKYNDNMCTCVLQCRIVCIVCVMYIERYQIIIIYR